MAVTFTVPRVRLPALGEDETTLPLPMTRWRQPARLSFRFACLTVRPRSFGTLHFLRLALGELTIGTCGGGAGATAGAVSIRPILWPVNSVNQSAPSGPGVISEGWLAGVGVGKWFVIRPPVVIRPIVLPSDSVNQSAPSRPGAMADGPAAVPGNSVTAPPVVMKPIWLAADSVNQSPPGPVAMPEGSLAGVGTG